ncbi:MAG: CDGSH iron-sulfur domain-containing protein [Myxococcota bacterium]
MADGIEEVPGKKILVRFEAKRCVHTRHCVLEHPDVFVPNVQGEWIRPDAVAAEAVVKVAERCPSGAIRYERLDGGPAEAPPVVNLVRVRENGPLAFSAELRVGDDTRYRATLCRCGASKNKPYCDGQHAVAGFVATGEPPTVESPAIAVRNGPLEVTPTRDGPLRVSGSVEIVSGTGRTLAKKTEAWLCRCGASANKPYCDGAHRKIGFVADGE